MADFKKYKAKKEKLKMEENKGKSEDLIAISLRWWITEKEEKEAKKKKKEKGKKNNGQNGQLNIIDIRDHNPSSVGMVPFIAVFFNDSRFDY